MLIYTLWIRRAGSDPLDTPELIEAWDEFSIDENPEGFKQACRDALNSIGSDVIESRYININVPHKTILAAFEVPEVGGW